MTRTCGCASYFSFILLFVPLSVSGAAKQVRVGSPHDGWSEPLQLWAFHSWLPTFW